MFKHFFKESQFTNLVKWADIKRTAWRIVTSVYTHVTPHPDQDT